MAGLLGATPKDQAAQLYKSNFGREGDPQGINYWADQINSGKPAAQVQTDFTNSANQVYKDYAANPTGYDAANPGLSNNFKSDAGFIAPTGLLGTQKAPQPTSNAEAVKALAKGYTATNLNVSPESTVQYQLNQIIGNNSPLNQQAETYANQQSNRRGLLNSSMAVGAAQDAVIRNAMPIAQQDAGVYANAGQFNATAQNAASQFGATAFNAAEQTNAQIGTNVNLANVDNEMKLQLQSLQSNTQLSLADRQAASNQIISKGDNSTKLLLQGIDGAAKLSQLQMDQDTKIKIANLDAGTKTSLAQVEAGNRQLLQTNINAADMYRQYATALANISSSNQMDAGAKQQAMNNQLAALNAGLQAIGEVSGLDLSKYFEASTLLPAANNSNAAAGTTQNTPVIDNRGDGGGD